MAGGGAKRGGGRGRRPVPRTSSPRGSSTRSQPAGRKKTPASAAPPAPAPSAPPGPFRLGAVAGATPGKWIDTWNQRMPEVELQLIPVTGDRQQVLLVDDEVDAALVRLPIDTDTLHTIVLYDEIPVVVCAADSHLTAADELQLDDLADELVIAPRDDVLHIEVLGALTPAFDPPETTEEAIATVAAGVGIVIVPMSLARLHHRKDVAHRPLSDGPTSTVALAWPVGRTNPHVDTFIGIVRGRTANSSRS